MENFCHVSFLYCLVVVSVQRCPGKRARDAAGCVRKLDHRSIRGERLPGVEKSDSCRNGSRTILVYLSSMPLFLNVVSGTMAGMCTPANISVMCCRSMGMLGSRGVRGICTSAAAWGGRQRL